VQFKFTVSKNIDSWFIKQPKNGRRENDIGASSSVEINQGSPAARKEGRENIGQISGRSVLLLNPRTDKNVHSVL
jgi:hypothetical protein